MLGKLLEISKPYFSQYSGGNFPPYFSVDVEVKLIIYVKAL